MDVMSLYAGQRFIPAPRDADYAMARVVWPALADAECAVTWDETVETLLAADLPVAVYDLAIDALHHRRHVPPQSATPVERLRACELIAELRWLGYAGRVALHVGDLRRLVADLRRTCSEDF